MGGQLREPGLRDLPRAALADATTPYDPPDGWLKKARSENQTLAMRCWFLARFCDPQEETPWDSEDKVYVFVYGGPFEAQAVLENRFAGLVSDTLIEQLAHDLDMESGPEWAPCHGYRPDEEDELYELPVEGWAEPLATLTERLKQTMEVLALQGPPAVESPEGTAPSGAHRTGRERLHSSGSSCPACLPIKVPPVGEQPHFAACHAGQPLLGPPSVPSQSLVLSGRPIHEFVVKVSQDRPQR